MQLLALALVATGAGAQSADKFHGCSMDDLVGTYDGSYGGMDCETNGPGLDLLLRPITTTPAAKAYACRKDEESGLLRGIWIYSNGTKGTIEFSVNPDCTIGDGAWGYNDKNTSAWAVRKRLSKAIERDPKLKSGGNTFDAVTAAAGASAAVAKSATLDPELEGLVGEWRGYYRCDGGYENFMRLTISRDEPAVRMDFGTGLRGGVVLPGAYTMAATLDKDSQQIDFSGVDWIHKPGGRAWSFLKFSGRVDRTGNQIAGTVAGKFADSYPCSTFSVSRRRPPPAENPDGLLFRVTDDGRITATEADCMRYAQWLAENEEINRSGNWYFNGVFDQDEMRRVLGRDMRLWQAGDHKNLAGLEPTLRATAAPGHGRSFSGCRRSKRDVGLSRATLPLDWGKYDKNGIVYRSWLQLEQGLLANETGLSQVDQRIAEMAALPPTVASLRRLIAG